MATGMLSMAGVSSVLSRRSDRKLCGGGGGDGEEKGKLRKPLMSGALGPASEDYGFLPPKDRGDSASASETRNRRRKSDIGFRRGEYAASDGYDSSSSAGSSMSARSARSLGSLMMKGRRKDKKKKKKDKKAGGGGSERRVKSTSKMIQSLRSRGRSSKSGNANNSSVTRDITDRDESDLDRDSDVEENRDDDFPSPPGSPQLSLSFFGDTVCGSLPADGGSSAMTPSGKERSMPNEPKSGGNGGGGKSASRRFSFPAPPSSLWRCALPSCAHFSANSDHNEIRHHGHHRLGCGGGDGGCQPGPSCCSSSRVGADGHTLAATVPPVPPFMNAHAVPCSSSFSTTTTSSCSSHSSLGHPKGGGSTEGGGVGGDSGAAPWANALAGAAVFGTGMAARAAGVAANGGCVPYSLRSAITDGGEPQPDGPTSMERRTLRPNGSHLAMSHWSDGNRRGYMEDRYAIEPMGDVTIEVIAYGAAKNQLALQNSSSPRGVDDLDLTRTDEAFSFDVHSSFRKDPIKRIIVPATLFGVYDGHGGPNASQYCSDWMATYVRRQQSWPVDFCDALRCAFERVDDDFVESGHLDGTTACVALVLGSERIICANAGDSRAVVVRRDGSVAKLSTDHKPGTPGETKRITDLGGKIMYMGGRWRVEGSLAVSRGVGDAPLKPYISSAPEFCEYDLDDNDLFLVVATDGVWDVLENSYVANIVLRRSIVAGKDCTLPTTDPTRLRSTARRLCDEARRQGSSDNLCALIVDLKSSVHPQSRPAR